MYEKIIYIFHIIVLIFIVFSWAILPSSTLKYQMLIVPIVFFDWNDDGSCILTKLEHYMRAGEWEQKTSEDEGGPEFFRPILEKITGRKFDRIIASRINYVIFIVAWLITYYKFLKRYNIKLFADKLI